MNNHKFLFLGTLISGIFVSALTFATEAQAQTNDCPARPRIGYRCYQDRTLRARSGYPGEDTQGWTYSPPPGYQLMDYQEVVQSRFGEGGGINVNLVRGGTFSQLSSSIVSSNRVLSDYRGRIESYARFPISGVPITVGGETEVIDRTLRENEQRLQMLSSDYSNVDRVQVSVTVRGRCTRSAPLVGCVDNEGGKYEGYLRFFLEYVGNPSDVIASNEAVIRRAQESLTLLQSQASTVGQQPDGTLSDLINHVRSGNSFTVTFDRVGNSFNDSGWTGSTDPMGTLQAGYAYQVTYSGGSYTTVGFNEQSRSQLSATYSNANPDDAKISLWGRVYTFDELGNVYDPQYGLVGTLRF